MALLSATPDTVTPRLALHLLINARDHHGQASPIAFEAAGIFDGKPVASSIVQIPTLHKAWIKDFDLPLEWSRDLPDRDNRLYRAALELPLHSGEWAGR